MGEVEHGVVVGVGAGEAVGYGAQGAGEAGVGEAVADGGHPLDVLAVEGAGGDGADAVGEGGIEGG